jgi:hypothetical protein
VRPFKNWFAYIHPKSFFEYNGPELFDESPYLNIGTTQRWRGPFLRIGNMRFKVERTTNRYKVENYPDRVDYQFHFYYDRANTYKGDRNISWNRTR